MNIDEHKMVRKEHGKHMQLTTNTLTCKTKQQQMITGRKLMTGGIVDSIK